MLTLKVRNVAYDILTMLKIGYIYLYLTLSWHCLLLTVPVQDKSGVSDISGLAAACATLFSLH